MFRFELEFEYDLENEMSMLKNRHIYRVDVVDSNENIEDDDLSEMTQIVAMRRDRSSSVNNDITTPLRDILYAISLVRLACTAALYGQKLSML